MTEKPLFIPLKTKYYDAFDAGTKTHELRLYGARWNERTCRIGRRVVLSKGYGKANRLSGRITSFTVSPLTEWHGENAEAIRAIYGEREASIASIGIDIEREERTP
ncbi:MAG TPA: hypothetical protein PLX33_09825 [Alphaproteobacteria bacterium]|nr:hypothetical protein [Alphaproteobacteria bacterium]